MIFCNECGRFIKTEKARLCLSCGKYFCFEHITQHKCGDLYNVDEEPNVRDWVQIEGRPGIYKVLSKLGQEIIVISLATGKLDHIFSPPTKVSKILKPLERLSRGIFDSPEKFDLYVDALRLRYAYLFDEASVLSMSKIDPLPYQIEAVYRIMIDSPEPRFLLADDVGLGKTITAGMLLKELKLRERVKRVLIVVPPALQYKWEKEMRRFNERFHVIDGETLKTLSIGERNPWQELSQVITSMDLAKISPYIDWLKSVEWDLVIIDEAHKLSAHRHGNRTEYTDRFKLGELLSLRTKSLLLLTATPHSGESFAFYKLISLVDPYLFPSEYYVSKEKLRRIMIRRLKEDIGIFPPRKVHTLSINLSDEEKRLYEELVKYVSYYFNLAKIARNRGVGFAMVILQKRMGSSIYALKKSLENRLKGLKQILEGKLLPEITEEDIEIMKEYEENPEDVDERDLERIRKKYEAMSIFFGDKGSLKREIEQVDHLLKLAHSIKVDTKASSLIRFIKELHEKDPDEKVLVFTEYRDTMEYLKDLLEKSGYEKSIAYIHGSMSVEEREEQMRIFRENSNVKIMVATDAAAEGIDLQYNCHIMVNYELPWNPNRIEQRMGRLHRYGQTRTVLVYNIFEDTIEARVLQRLFEKIDTIRREMGERVFDVIGKLLSGIRIEDIIMDIIAVGKEKFEYKMAETFRKIDENRKSLELIEKRSLIKDLLDINFVERLEKSRLESAISELDVERFMKKYIVFSGGSLEEIDEGIYKVKLPNNLEDILQLKTGECVTFSRNLSERKFVRLLTLGSSIVDRALQLCSNPSFGGWTAVKVDPKGGKGLLLIYSYHIGNVGGDLFWKTLFTIFYDVDKDEVYEVNPKVIWDLKNPEEIVSQKDASEMLEKGMEKICSKLVDLKRKFVENLKRKLERELSIRLEDVDNFYSIKIAESEKRIKKYKERALFEDMRVAIGREEANIRLYKEEWERKKRELKAKYTLMEGEEPELLAAAVIIPPKEHSLIAANIREIERKGIEEAIKYELSQGRKPIDVSTEFRGYDIISEGTNERRFIEVKSFFKGGDIEMTSNEWLMAERLRDKYWLYIVENTMDDEKRKLSLIQNPYEALRKVANFKEVKDFKVFIEEESWRSTAYTVK
ncbi:MAG: helicase-related protein [Ignisphaera sp.]